MAEVRASDRTRSVQSRLAGCDNIGRSVNRRITKSSTDREAIISVTSFGGRRKRGEGGKCRFAGNTIRIKFNKPRLDFTSQARFLSPIARQRYSLRVTCACEHSSFQSAGSTCRIAAGYPRDRNYISTERNRTRRDILFS